MKKTAPDANQISEEDKKELFQLLSQLPASERFEQALKKEYPEYDPEKINQLIETLKQKLENAERALAANTERDQKAREKASEIALQVPKEKFELVYRLAHFQLHLEDIHFYLTTIFATPPNDLLALLVELAHQAQAVILLNVLWPGEAFQDEDRPLIYGMAALLDWEISRHVNRHKETTNRAPSQKEQKLFRAREEKRIIALIDFLFPDAFDKYLETARDFEDLPNPVGRPRMYEDATELYRYEFKLKYPKRRVNAFKIEPELVRYVMKAERAAPQEYPLYKKGIENELKRSFTSKKKKKDPPEKTP